MMKWSDNMNREFVEWLKQQAWLYRDDLKGFDPIKEHDLCKEWMDIAKEYDHILAVYLEMVGSEENDI